MRFREIGLLCAVAVAGTVAPGAYAQSSNAGREAAAADNSDAAQTSALAESIVSREEQQSGRNFDPAYRAAAVQALAALPASRLEAQQPGFGLGNAVGDTGADLVYTPLTPCRILDTRSGGGPIAAGATRNVIVAGTASFPAQGGKSGGCGVPVGATAAMINFVAVGASAAGDLRVTPFGTAMPTASILNWAGGVPGLNLANGLAVALCNPATTTCTADITLQADASAIDIVADVQGYFFQTTMPMGADAVASFAAVAGAQNAMSAVTVALAKGGVCLVTCELDLEAAVTTGPGFFTTARLDVAAGTTAIDPGWGNDLTFPSTRTSGSKTGIWTMAAGRSYRFGCNVFAGGDVVGKTLYPTVAWTCR